MNLFNFLNRQKRWSKNTFGPTPRKEGLLKHIEREIEDVRTSEGKELLTEWVDIVILALDGAWRSGATPHEICQALEQKQAINMAREWPGGLTAPDDVPVEHEREEPQ